jgi:hypothetical protein
MRMIVAFPLLMLAACAVESDSQNDQVTLEVDEGLIENTAEDLGNAAEEAASELGNAAGEAGRAVENEVGDIELDVDVNRNRADSSK